MVSDHAAPDALAQGEAVLAGAAEMDAPEDPRFRVLARGPREARERAGDAHEGGVAGHGETDQVGAPVEGVLLAPTVQADYRPPSVLVPPRNVEARLPMSPLHFSSYNRCARRIDNGSATAPRVRGDRRHRRICPGRRASAPQPARPVTPDPRSGGRSGDPALRPDRPARPADPGGRGSAPPQPKPPYRGGGAGRAPARARGGAGGRAPSGPHAAGDRDGARGLPPPLSPAAPGRRRAPRGGRGRPPPRPPPARRHEPRHDPRRPPARAGA